VIVSSYYTGIKECDDVLRELYACQSILEHQVILHEFLDVEIQQTLMRLHSQVVKFQDFILRYKRVPKSKRLKRLISIVHLWYPH